MSNSLSRIVTFLLREIYLQISTNSWNIGKYINLVTASVNRVYYEPQNTIFPKTDILDFSKNERKDFSKNVIFRKIKYISLKQIFAVIKFITLIELRSIKHLNIFNNTIK